METLRLNPGETRRISFPVVDGNRAQRVVFRISAECHCGGRMVPAGHDKDSREQMRCERSHWWNRRRHAFLVFEARIERLEPDTEYWP